MIRLPPVHRELLALSLPIAGVQFAQIALTTTDLIMMGLIGTEAVAAGGLALLLYNQFRTMCVGMVTGVGNLVALAYGQGESRTGVGASDALAREDIRDLIRSALLLATLVALLAGVSLVALSECLGVFGQDTAVVSLARPVVLALAPGLLPMVWLNVLRQFAVGMRRPGSLLAVTLVSIAVNAALNALFIYGWLGVPQLGLAGVGLSTTCVHLWTLLVYLRAVRRTVEFRGLVALDFWRARPSTVLRIARMGTPIALAYGLEAAVASLASVLIGLGGAVALAASNVVYQLTKIVYQINVALSHGSSIMVSRALGRGRHGEIGAIAQAALLMGWLPMAATGLVYLLLPQWVLLPFLGAHPDPAVYSAAAALLWLGAVSQVLAATQNICIGLLRGLGNTASGLTLTSVGYGMVGLPAVYVCSQVLGWGAEGVWLGMCIAFGAASLLLWRRFAGDLKRGGLNFHRAPALPHKRESPDLL